MDHAENVNAEVLHQHQLLSDWLGSGTDPAVLAELHASLTADFSMITTTGAVLDREALLTGLEGEAGGAPGMRIDISDVTVITRLGDAVLVRFLETHVMRDRTTVRLVSALLRTEADRLRWAYVHETPVDQPSMTPQATTPQATT